MLVPYNVFASQIVIAVDNGHGVNTPGKRSPIFLDSRKTSLGKNFMHEWEFNRATAIKLVAKLKACGFKVVETSPTSVDTSLGARCDKANAAGADLMVSIHANANTSKWGDWGGIETLTVPSGKSLAYGKKIQAQMIKATGLRDRGMKDGSWLYVAKHTRMPLVLVECGFMDNWKECQLLLSDSYRDTIATAIAKGVCESFGVSYKGESSPAPKPVAPVSPATSGTFTFVKPSRVLGKGDKGADVTHYQKALQFIGYPLSKYGADGDFGDESVTATKTFQSENHLTADGLAGDSTYSALAKKIAEVNEENTPKKPVVTGSIFKVQCGAFKEEANAKELVEALKKAGFDSFPTLVNGLYKVQVGAFGDKANAEELVSKLKSRGFDSFIDVQ